MSNAGQGLLAIAGGIIGFYVGGPQGAAVGFQAGLALGTVVSPTQLPGTFGPRLTDNRTTTSQLGAPIIELFGTDVTSGTVIWIGDVVEHASTTSAGKGGPEQDQTTYTYTQDIAIGLCRGPKAGILRIWENGKLVYDRRPQQPDESDETYLTRILASDSYEAISTVDISFGGLDDIALNVGTGFTLYLGDEDQLPDPTIEAKEGVGNVPAFRGLMYIVFPSRLLRDDQARRHPNFKFEVFELGETNCVTVEEYAQEVIYPWLPGVRDPRDARQDYTYQLVNIGAAHPNGAAPPLFTDFDTVDEIMSLVAAYKGRQYPFSTYIVPGASPAATALQGGPRASDNTSGDLDLYFYAYSESGVLVYPDNLSPVCEDLPLSGEGWLFVQGNDLVSDTEALFAGDENPGYDDPNYENLVNCGGKYFWIDRAVVIRAHVANAMAPEGFTLDDTRNYHVLRQYVPGSFSSTSPLGPALPVGHASDTELFWTEAYNTAVAGDEIEAGLVYGVDYPEVQDHGYLRSAEICAGTAEQISLATIVQRICARCTLVDVDVSDLEDRFVNGYSINRVMDGRSAINPLRSVGFFDAVDSGGVVKFPVRGRPNVRALGLEDLGAHNFGSDAGPSVTTRKQQDVELPRQLFVQYRDPARDYETGEQPSPTRTTTDAVNDVYVDVAVAISATQAAQCAEVLWADMWAGRWAHSIAVDGSQIELEPTDAFTIPVDGRNERVRAVTADDMAGILRTFSLVRDDDGSYVSTVVADAPAVRPQPMQSFARSNVVLLDLPPLRSTDDNAGVYAAIGRAAAGTTWGGASLYRSTDSGETFTTLISVSTEAIVGTLVKVLPPAAATIWDQGNEIIVDIARGSFASCTQEDALGGLNLLAIGAHGRWLLVSFTTAEQVGANRWRLTELLQGRRGTEHNISTGLAGDAVVLISGDGIGRVPLEVPEVHLPFTYRAVTVGTQLATGTDAVFTGDGEALRPFSPVHIEGTRDDDGNLTIDWVRRDRMLLDYVPSEPTPMSESVEDYEVDILDSTAAIRRTMSSSLQNLVYSAEQQVTDFGELQGLLTVRVVQISVAIGRGHTSEATI